METKVALPFPVVVLFPSSLYLLLYPPPSSFPINHGALYLLSVRLDAPPLSGRPCGCNRFLRDVFEVFAFNLWWRRFDRVLEVVMVFPPSCGGGLPFPSCEHALSLSLIKSRTVSATYVIAGLNQSRRPWASLV
ncbi:hypothetical protein CRG98_037673 [Punica granatum]|uniref:Uncharacterized protein n=1 Tax=Punica granatum TaxID=22663 RepID=A0A2I0IDP6_PUNGR|nr:hypothetical protein CRG98_037673 [Punica granatum]